MSNSISRRSFIKGLAASAVGLAAGSAFQAPKAIAEGTAAAFIPGTYTSVQTTPYATVEVKCIFSESALTDVSYEVLKTSKADYFTPFANPINSYCQRIVDAGTTEGVDGVKLIPCNYDEVVPHIVVIRVTASKRDGLKEFLNEMEKRGYL